MLWILISDKNIQTIQSKKLFTERIIFIIPIRIRATGQSFWNNHKNQQCGSRNSPIVDIEDGSVPQGTAAQQHADPTKS